MQSCNRCSTQCPVFCKPVFVARNRCVSLCLPQRRQVPAVAPGAPAPSSVQMPPAVCVPALPPSHGSQGDPTVTLPGLVRRTSASLLITDYSPLRLGKAWRAGVAAGLPAGVPMHEVDAHNVVPVWVASDKREVRLPSHDSWARLGIRRWVRWLLGVPGPDSGGLAGRESGGVGCLSCCLPCSPWQSSLHPCCRMPFC
jgi:hypothetical protein